MFEAFTCYYLKKIRKTCYIFFLFLDFLFLETCREVWYKEDTKVLGLRCSEKSEGETE